MSPSWIKILAMGLAFVFVTACQVAPGSPSATAPSPTAAPSAAAAEWPSATPARTVAPDVSSPESPTEDAVPRIMAESLKARLDAGEEVVIVDTRSLENFREKHIAGAVSMPLVEVDLRYRELPKDKTIVLYCT